MGYIKEETKENLRRKLCGVFSGERYEWRRIWRNVFGECGMVSHRCVVVAGQGRGGCYCGAYTPVMCAQLEEK